MNFSGKIVMCFLSVWYVIPLLLLRANMSTGAQNNRSWCVRLGNIRASACPMVAFSGFYESHEPSPLGDACSKVPPHRDGHWNGQQSGYILHNRWFDCRPGGCLSNTEQVVAQWQSPVASGEALVMLHRVMRSESHRRTAMAIEIARDGGAFDRRRCLFWLL